MPKPTAEAECPPLPSGPVDLDALLKACEAGKSPEEAIAAATKNNPKPEEVKPDPEQDAGEPEKAAPSALPKE